MHIAERIALLTARKCESHRVSMPRDVRKRTRSRPSLPLISVCFLAQGCLCAAAAAEELSLLGGVSDTDDHTHGTYAWGLEYRQRLLTHLDASFGYLNEGHLPQDHRDGGMLQFWATTGPWHDRFTLAVGAGPYVYFDTQYHYNYQGYVNQHGVAAIVSGRVTYSLSPRWFVLLDANQVMAANPATRSILLGVGYRLEPFAATSDWHQGGQAAGAAESRNEVGFFVGETTLNDLSYHKSNDFGFEYRYRCAPHVELSAGLLEEGSGAVQSHASVTGEVWAVQDFLDERFAVGLGIGPDAALNTYQTADGRSGASVIGLASMTLSWRFTRPLVLRVNWHRAFTTDDQDRDIITVGLGLRF
jgi:hypothetical protein